MILTNRHKGVDVHPRTWIENTASDIMNKFRIMAVVCTPFPEIPCDLVDLKAGQGPFMVTKSFLSNLEKSHAPKIINISSDYASLSGMQRSSVRISTNDDF